MSSIDYEGRIGRLRSEMSEKGIDSVFLSVGADLPYFTGYEAMATERLTLLVIGLAGDPVLFIPRLEAPRVDPGPFEIVPWDESEDPFALATGAAGRPSSVAIGDRTWARFLVQMQGLLPDTEWSSASAITRTLRMRKDSREIEALRRAGQAVDRVLARVPSEIRFSGRTEVEVSRDFAGMTTEEGHEHAAHAMVASGPNGSSPHHEAGPRVIEPGDVVVCDFGGRFDGYFSDVSRTFVVGEPSEYQAEIHEIVEAANAAGRRAVSPGVACEDVDRAARDVIDEVGYGEFFIHRTGHGIGLDVHEHPYIVEGNRQVLEPGMTFSIEPGIYLPGEFGVRIEDIVACVSDGVDELNRADRSLVVVG